MSYVSNYEKQYMNTLMTALEHGTEDLNKRTGVVTYRLPAAQFSVDLQKEVPILKSKKVFWKSAVEEILWIMQKQSNNTKDLRPKIWDQWADEDGSINKSYGYQVAKSVTISGKTYKSQVHYVLETLEADPSSRRCVIDLWNVEDLNEMNLTPCCYSSVWNVIDGKLNCMLVQRSADMPVGVPFDTVQYAVLTHLFARHLGVEPGLLTHCMADTHIYKNQVEGVEKMIENYSMLMAYSETIKKPKIVIKESVKSFWDVTIDDIDIVDYEPKQKIDFEVAV